MMEPLPEIRRSPAILIGLGGFGVHTLRCVLSLAEQGDDPGLRAALNRGALQLVAIDAGPLSIQQQKVHEKDLPVIETLSLQGLNQWNSIRNLIGNPHEWNVNYNLINNIPDISQLKIYDFSNGTNRYRPLGRLILHLNATTVFDKLRDSYREMRNYLPAEEPVRVFILCSLSGGTGSGIFQDIAQMMRLIDPNCHISGEFMLTDTVNAATDSHASANIYAALKEIAVCKNWRLKPGSSIISRYSIGHRDFHYKATAGIRGLFDSIFLYNDRNKNRSRSGGDTTAFNLAQTVLGRLRYDCIMALRRQRNMHSDHDFPLSAPESRKIFSTSLYVPFWNTGPKTLAAVLWSALLHRLRRWADGKFDRLSAADTARLLIPHPSKGENAVATEPLPPPMTFFRDTLSAAPPPDCHLIADIQDRMEHLKQQAGLGLQAGRWPGWMEDRTTNIKKLYKTHVPEVLRNAWSTALANDRWRQDGAVAALSAEEVFEHELHTRWAALCTFLKRLEQDVRQHKVVLSDEAVAWLRSAEAQRPAMAAGGGENAGPALRLPAPPSLIQMRAELGLLKPGRDDDLAAWQKAYGGGPAAHALASFAGRLSDAVKAVDLSALSRDHWWVAVATFSARKTAEILSLIDAILAANNEVMEKRIEFNKIIERSNDIFSHETISITRKMTDDFDNFSKSIFKCLEQIFNDEENNQYIIEETATNLAVDIEYQDKITSDFSKNQRNKADIYFWVMALKSLHELLNEIFADKDRLSRDKNSAMSTAGPLASWLERTVLSPHVSLLDSPPMMATFLSRCEDNVRGFVSFWYKQPAVILAMFGDLKQLEQIIWESRHSVFDKVGAYPNLIKTHHFILGLPGMNHQITAYKQNKYEYLCEIISGIINKKEETKIIFSQSISPFICRYDFGFDPKEIMDIHHYRESYMAFEKKEYLHTRLTAVEFDDLVEPVNAV